MGAPRCCVTYRRSPKLFRGSLRGGRGLSLVQLFSSFSSLERADVVSDGEKPRPPDGAVSGRSAASPLYFSARLLLSKAKLF